MVPTVILDGGTTLLHTTQRKTPTQMESLEEMADDTPESSTARSCSLGSAQAPESLRWPTIIREYMNLRDNEFPTNLQHPKWFTLPLHVYGGDVVLEYTLQRPVVLADLRGYSVRSGTSRLPHQARSYRAEADDVKAMFATVKFSADTWPYYYYSANKYNLSGMRDELEDMFEGIDGWLAHDGDDTDWVEIMLVHPSESVNPPLQDPEWVS